MPPYFNNSNNEIKTIVVLSLHSSHTGIFFYILFYTLDMILWWIYICFFFPVNCLILYRYGIWYLDIKWVCFIYYMSLIITYCYKVFSILTVNKSGSSNSQTLGIYTFYFLLIFALVLIVEVVILTTCLRMKGTLMHVIF